MGHLATLERANLVTARVMGSVEHMRILTQRYVPQGHADETDTMAMETSGDEGENEVPSVQESTTTPPSSAESMTGLLDFLKVEHLGCLERLELWDANAI